MLNWLWRINLQTYVPYIHRLKAIHYFCWKFHLHKFPSITTTTTAFSKQATKKKQNCGPQQIGSHTIHIQMHSHSLNAARWERKYNNAERPFGANKCWIVWSVWLSVWCLTKHCRYCRCRRHCSCCCCCCCCWVLNAGYKQSLKTNTTNWSCINIQFRHASICLNVCLPVRPSVSSTITFGMGPCLSCPMNSKKCTHTIHTYTHSHTQYTRASIQMNIQRYFYSEGQFNNIKRTTHFRESVSRQCHQLQEDLMAE